MSIAHIIMRLSNTARKRGVPDIVSFWEQATGASVHMGMVNHCGIRSCWLAARPILQEYDAFTVVEASQDPAESGKLAARHNIVYTAKACWRE